MVPSSALQSSTCTLLMGSFPLARKPSIVALLYAYMPNRYAGLCTHSEDTSSTRHAWPCPSSVPLFTLRRNASCFHAGSLSSVCATSGMVSFSMTARDRNSVCMAASMASWSAALGRSSGVTACGLAHPSRMTSMRAFAAFHSSSNFFVSTSSCFSAASTSARLARARRSAARLSAGVTAAAHAVSDASSSRRSAMSSPFTSSISKRTSAVSWRTWSWIWCASSTRALAARRRSFSFGSYS